MKIAEVSVNEKSLPSKEQLVKMALNTSKYYQLPKKKALSLIEKEIKASGLYNTSKKRGRKSNRSNSQSS